MCAYFTLITPGEFERVLHPIFEQDELTLIVSGAVLGAGPHHPLDTPYIPPIHPDTPPIHPLDTPYTPHAHPLYTPIHTPYTPPIHHLYTPMHLCTPLYTWQTLTRRGVCNRASVVAIAGFIQQVWTVAAADSGPTEGEGRGWGRGRRGTWVRRRERGGAGGRGKVCGRGVGGQGGLVARGVGRRRGVGWRGRAGGWGAVGGLGPVGGLGEAVGRGEAGVRGSLGGRAQ